MDWNHLSSSCLWPNLWLIMSNMISYAGLVLCSVLNPSIFNPRKMQVFLPKKPILVTLRFRSRSRWMERPNTSWSVEPYDVGGAFDERSNQSLETKGIQFGSQNSNTSQLLLKWGKITTFKEACSFKFQPNPPKKKRRNIKLHQLPGFSHLFDENALMGFNWGSVIHGVRMLLEPGKADGARTPCMGCWYNVKTLRWLEGGWLMWRISLRSGGCLVIHDGLCT